MLLFAVAVAVDVDVAAVDTVDTVPVILEDHWLI
jgi:hypothetical protein